MQRIFINIISIVVIVAVTVAVGIVIFVTQSKLNRK